MRVEDAGAAEVANESVWRDEAVASSNEIIDREVSLKS
jgi:hypothetical protein